MSNTPLPTHLSDSTKSHQENIFESQILLIPQLGMDEEIVECCIEHGTESLERLEERFNAITSHPFPIRVTEEHVSGCKGITGSPCPLWFVCARLLSCCSWEQHPQWPWLVVGTSLLHHHFRNLGSSQHKYLGCLLTKVSEFGQDQVLSLLPLHSSTAPLSHTTDLPSQGRHFAEIISLK